MTKRVRGDPAVIEDRRRLVAALRLRGGTLREIETYLARLGEHNKETGRPWSRGIIHTDLRALEALWRKQAAEDIATRKALVNAKLEEVQRQAWGAGDLKIVLDAIRQQRELFGLDTPVLSRTEHLAGAHEQVHIYIPDNGRDKLDEQEEEATGRTVN